MSRDARDETMTGRTGEAVRLLFKNLVSDSEAIAKLRKQYPSDEEFVTKVFDAYKERMEIIKEKASKFKNALLTRYRTLPLYELIKKAKKFKNRYKLSDDEFTAFINEISSNRSYWDVSLNTPRGVMASVMGHPSYHAEAFGGKLHVKSNELETLQQIMKINGETLFLYRQIVLQSLTYKDCAYQAITGEYDPKRYNLYSHIHPIVAALFLPKITLLDEHMLMANLSNIIKLKYEGKRILTQPDYELFWDIVSDPNDVMCLTNRDSPIADLRTRVLIQVKLWENVLNLRSGRYYGDKFGELITLLEGCNNNIFDAADLAYIRDEGTLIRRLLGVFSLRPTYVSIRPIATTPIGSLHEIGVVPFIQYTTIPMITLRLPVDRNNTEDIDLMGSFEQTQHFIENKMIIQKSQSVIFSRNLLIFYVNRRYHHVDFKLMTTPYSFTTLPTTFSMFNAVNEKPIKFDEILLIDNNQYKIRSIIFVEKLTGNNLKNINMIVGCSAAILTNTLGRFEFDGEPGDGSAPLSAGPPHPAEEGEGAPDEGAPLPVVEGGHLGGSRSRNPKKLTSTGLDEVLIYNPQNAGKYIKYAEDNNPEHEIEEQNPISWVNKYETEENTDKDKEDTFEYIFRHAGTVYIYVKDDEIQYPEFKYLSQ